MSKWLSEIRLVAGKEFKGFFSTPAAYLFLGGFLASILFAVFWVEAFFARNIADARPLFQWLPLLMIFLVAALTMRTWSEERRSGTLESLLTAPISPLQLVLGKFTASFWLISLALLLTLPLPVTISFMGHLDWGPVIGGYIATLFLSAAYISIGQYMSGRTDNPIVALIMTTIVCAFLYLVGSDTLTNLFGYRAGEFFGLIGTGTRFESITRGVLDFRDLYYYASIVGVFLSLNLLSLEKLRWAGNPNNKVHRLWHLGIILATANLIAANLWLHHLGWIRVDITAEQRFTLSAATEQQLDELQEPLVITGYFSEKTHPLLQPLIPSLTDLLEEYSTVGGNRVRVEFVDPTKDREAEEAAATLYDLRPVPFQTADRYQSAVVSSYFDLVVAYGDQYEKLGFRDLIEVKARGEGDVRVVLKNPEYSITRVIKKVAANYRSGADSISQLKSPISIKAYVSQNEVLPPILIDIKEALLQTLTELQSQSAGKVTYEFVDPNIDDGALAKELEERFGFGPQVASLLDPRPFWFYVVIESAKGAFQVPLPQTLDAPSIKRAVDSAIMRLTPGALKTVALMKPEAFGPQAQQYRYLADILGQNVLVIETQVEDGYVMTESDLLLLMAPSKITDLQKFAVDQFLMQGGSVVVITSPFNIEVASTLSAKSHESGLADWLFHHGISIGDSLVLDPYNAALPVPVERYIGGIAVQEYRMLPYPHFPDLRGEGLNASNPITSALDQLTLNWASPISIDFDINDDREVTQLLTSSPESWITENTDLIPNYESFPENGFVASEDRNVHVLAIALQGRFESFYKDMEPPPLPADDEPRDEDGEGESNDVTERDIRISGVIERSPDSAKLVVIASNSFATDTAIDLASQGVGTFYTKPLDFIQNTVDWSLEDSALLQLRGRTELARTLYPMTERTRRMWEWINYASIFAGLMIVLVWRRRSDSADLHRHNEILAEV